MRELKVAVVQMRPELAKMEENVGKMSETIARIATEQPVDVIVFPELSVTGYEVARGLRKWRSRSLEPLRTFWASMPPISACMS